MNAQTAKVVKFGQNQNSAAGAHSGTKSTLSHLTAEVANPLGAKF